MFRKADLEQLQAQKSLLVVQSEINRLQLLSDWQKVRSPKNWVNGAGGMARRFPILMAALAGTLAVKTFRKPNTVMGRIKNVGKFAAVAFSAWKLSKRKKS